MFDDLLQKRITIYDGIVTGTFPENPHLGQRVSEIVATQRMNESDRDKFIYLVTDWFLEVITENSFLRLLSEHVGFSQETSNEIVAQIKPLIEAGVYEGNVPKADGTVKEELELRPQGVPRPEIRQMEEAPKPLTREDVLSALASRRTMASDIESVKKNEEEKEN